jgi:hypothetical protein
MKSLKPPPRQPRPRHGKADVLSWVGVDDELMREYHDREWGVPAHAGLSLRAAVRVSAPIPRG